MNNNSSPRISLLLGIILIVWGTYIITTGSGGSYWGVPVPVWSGWIFLPVGIYICVLSVRALRRGEGKPKKHTDEDAVRAKERLDRMFLHEHGSLPEESTPEEAKSEKIKPKTAPGRSVSAPKITAPIRQGLLAMLAGVVLFLTGNMVALIMGVALLLFGLCRLARGLMEVV